MIASGVVVYVSCQPVDFRKGAASLMALVRDGGLDPFLCVERDYVAEPVSAPAEACQI
ncbi:transposase [Sinorhizobium meliloti]|nr:transposase [Sinorhizobium meliloti]